MLYDSRAAVYEKQNRIKDALRDAKKTIDIAPTQWHGYYRSARLFAALNISDRALHMCSLALERLAADAKHESRRRELTTLRSRLEACLIATIPVELLLMVFELVGRPVILSQVCRRWRHVALSQPILWRSLVLAGLPKKALRKAQEWRKRSCGRIAKLTIRKSLGEVILSKDNSWVHPDDIATRDHILAELRGLNLEYIKICNLEDVDVAQFLAALEGGTSDVNLQGMHYLETLSVSQTFSGGPVFFGSKAYAIRSWENLRALTINNIGCNWTALTKVLHGLISFEYRDSEFTVGFECVHLLLQGNPNLEKLVIENQTNRQRHLGEFKTLETLTLAHLHHLELDGVNLFYPGGPNLSLPSLQVLRLSRIPDMHTMLKNLVNDPGTSFAGLTELTVRDCLLGGPDLSFMLSQAPKLKILQLTGNIDFAIVTESLSKSYTTLLRFPISESIEFVPIELPILCPALSVLDLSGSYSLETGTLMRIVKERIALAASDGGGRYRLPDQDDDQLVSCIQVLKVDECPYIEGEMLPWFRKNVPMFSCRYIVGKGKESRRDIPRV
jgi:F-box/TPR repeat protein Pof3